MHGSTRVRLSERSTYATEDLRSILADRDWELACEWRRLMEHLR
jgi:hypothetical protein